MFKKNLNVYILPFIQRLLLKATTIEEHVSIAFICAKKQQTRSEMQNRLKIYLYYEIYE